MVTTPLVWSGPTAVFSGTGIQKDPVATAITDGSIITIWTDTENNIDSSTGDDIIGQVLSTLATPMDSPFQVNGPGAQDGSQGFNEAELVALGDGGFAALIQDGNRIVLARYDVAGALSAQSVVFEGSQAYDDGSIALLSDGNLVITALGRDNEDHYARIYDTASDTVGTSFKIVRELFFGHTFYPRGTQFSDTAALDAGMFTTIYAVPNGVDFSDLRGRIVQSDGTILKTFTVSYANDAFSPVVETLANGNFVVGWDRGGLGNGNSYFQIYDTNGNEVHSTNPRALANGSDEQNLDDILALKEGGFYAVHTNDTTGQIVGQRYSATGAAIGGTSTFTGSGADLSLTQDGRIVVTYTRNGDIYQVILDPREGFFGGTDDPDLYAGRQIDDVLGGGLGNDTLYGVGGNDFIGGAEDNDLLFGGAGGDTMNGNAGSDTMDGGTGNDELFGSTGNDRLIGGAGDDGLNGGDGSDTVFGSIGDDTIRNSLRGDSLSGGDGTDTLDNSGLAGGFGKGGLTSIHVDLRDETASVNDGLISPAIVSILGFENAIGTQSGNDILRGNGAANELTGGSGLNLLVGRVGDDILDGKSGNDTMTGGIGADTFVFSSALDGTANVDEITDFDVAEDTIQLSSTVFTAIAPGPLSADAFRLAGQTADTEDRIIYNASTGYLLYDADGSGTAATAIRFARLDAGLGVTADDFVIV